MKAIRLVWLLLFLMLNTVGAQQTNSSSGVTGDLTIKELTAKAEKGDADSQNRLGVCYVKGQGVTHDDAEAVKWFRKAAEQGYAKAQCNMGRCYAKGHGVTQDYAVALNWFLKAAEQDYAAAEYNVGVTYSFGHGVETNYIEAVKWYRKAAQHGLVEAEYNFGVALFRGQGVVKNLVEAAQWFEKAADQGHAASQWVLGNLYAKGEGVPKDMIQAANWYRKAAEQGFAAAQRSLGFAYELGNGVPKSYTEAYKWFNLASAQGFEATKYDRDMLARSMTAEQIAEGQRSASKFTLRKSVESNDKNGASDQNDDSDEPTATGTGFFITDDGYLISNYHVVKDATKVRLLTSAGLIDAKVVSVDAANDLALLKAVGRFASLPIAASRTVNLGGTVATIGFPNIGLQGFAPKLAKGEIASLSGAADDPRYFQISVPVQPGNSGGALVDERGNVIGIVSAKLDASVALAASGSLPENVNYAVKSSFLLGFLESVPDVSAKLKAPNTKEEKFEDVVKSAQDAAVLVLVY